MQHGTARGLPGSVARSQSLRAGKHRLHRVLGMQGILLGRAPEGDDRVADQLVDGRPVRLQDGQHFPEVFRHVGGEGLRPHRLGDRGEAADVGEKDRQRFARAADLGHLTAVYQFPHHLDRHVFGERLQRGKHLLLGVGQLTHLRELGSDRIMRVQVQALNPAAGVGQGFQRPAVGPRHHQGHEQRSQQRHERHTERDVAVPNQVAKKVGLRHDHSDPEGVFAERVGIKSGPPDLAT